MILHRAASGLMGSHPAGTWARTGCVFNHVVFESVDKHSRISFTYKKKGQAHESIHPKRCPPSPPRHALPERELRRNLAAAVGLCDYGPAKWKGGRANCRHAISIQIPDRMCPGAIKTGAKGAET